MDLKFLAEDLDEVKEEAGEDIIKLAVGKNSLNTSLVESLSSMQLLLKSQKRKPLLIQAWSLLQLPLLCHIRIKGRIDALDGNVFRNCGGFGQG